ncbi:MAG: DUF305 domain-containing protein [Labedaea sp.]
MTTGSDDDEQEFTLPSGQRRVIVLVVATVVVLVVGAAIGMLIALARGGGSNSPDAQSIDVGFAQDMRVHHMQAITMAGIERDRTADPELHSLAFDIESTQLSQAGTMAGWLNVWNQPELTDPGKGYMAWMAGSGHAHEGPTTAGGGVAQMPGMATSQELNKLRSLSGKESDVYFLQLMLRHHQGALPMAQYAAAHANVGYVRNLASKMVSAQTNEASLMVKMLADRGATPLPAPN